MRKWKSSKIKYFTPGGVKWARRYGSSFCFFPFLFGCTTNSRLKYLPSSQSCWHPPSQAYGDFLNNCALLYVVFVQVAISILGAWFPWFWIHLFVSFYGYFLFMLSLCEGQFQFWCALISLVFSMSCPITMLPLYAFLVQAAIAVPEPWFP